MVCSRMMARQMLWRRTADAAHKSAMTIPDPTGPTADRLARVRALYDQIRFELPFSRWEDYPVSSIPGCQYEPGDFAIQNNRSRDVAGPCSGGCAYCWVSEKARHLRRADRNGRPPIGQDTIDGYVDALVSMGVPVYLGGEDTLDDLESFWWTLAAYEDAVAKYRHAIPKYLLRVINHLPESRQDIERGLHRRPPRFGFTTNGVHFIRNPEHTEQFFRELRDRLASDTALWICLSWDAGKVRSYARRLRIGEDDVYDRMALVLAWFTRYFPSDPCRHINDQKHTLSLFQHDFGTGGTYRETQKAFLMNVMRRAARSVRNMGLSRVDVGTKIVTFRYYTQRGVRWGINEGRLRPSDFWPVSEFFERHPIAALGARIKHKPCLDYASETVSFDYNFQEFLRFRVTPDTLERAFVEFPFSNPVVRQGGHYRDHVRYALAVVPELAAQPVVSPEEIISYIYSDETLKLKIELLAFLDCLLTTETGGGDLLSVPLELMPCVCADDVLEAYLRYCNAVELQKARFTARHGAAFERETSGGKSLTEVIADNRAADRALFRQYLNRTVLARLAERGVFGAEPVDVARIRGQSLGEVRPPRLPYPSRANGRGADDPSTVAAPPMPSDPSGGQ